MALSTERRRGQELGAASQRHDARQRLFAGGAAHRRAGASVRGHGTGASFCQRRPRRELERDAVAAHRAERPKWNFPAPPHIGHVKHINFDPDNPTTIYASVEVGGLLKSTDGGQNWQEFPSLYEDVHRLMIHPSNPKFLYAVTGRGLYVSPDAGALGNNGHAERMKSAVIPTASCSGRRTPS